MKRFILALVIICAPVGCKNTTQNLPQPVQAVLQPIQDLGCAMETAFTGTMGTAIANACKGNAINCQAAIQPVFANVNFCSQPIPQAAIPQIKALATHPEWTKIGDIPASAINSVDGVKLKKMVQSMGVIGTVACPLAVGGIMGLLTPIIPAGCGCTQNLSASDEDTALTQLCINLTSSLP